MGAWYWVGLGVAVVVAFLAGLLINIHVGAVEAFTAGAGLKQDAAREGLGGAPEDLGAEVRLLRAALREAHSKLATGKRLKVDSDAALMLHGVALEAYATVGGVQPVKPGEP